MLANCSHIRTLEYMEKGYEHRTNHLHYMYEWLCFTFKIQKALVLFNNNNYLDICFCGNVIVVVVVVVGKVQKGRKYS